MLWDNTVNKAYRVKGEIQPLQNAAADGVRKDIGAFGEEVRMQPQHVRESSIAIWKFLWGYTYVICLFSRCGQVTPPSVRGTAAFKPLLFTGSESLALAQSHSHAWPPCFLAVLTLHVFRFRDKPRYGSLCYAVPTKFVLRPFLSKAQREVMRVAQTR